MAVLASMYANAHTPKGKPRPKLKDFLYASEAAKKQQSTKSFLHTLRSKSNAHR